MPRKHPRRTLAKGVIRDGACLELRVTVHGQLYTKKIPGDTQMPEAIRERKKLEATARSQQGARPARFTLEADAPRYLKLQTHLASYSSRKALVQHWVARLGDRPRHRITLEDVLAARVAWLDDDVSPKTINHRVGALAHLYRTLDGKRAPTPCDDVSPLPVPRTPIQRVSDATILAVDAALQRAERDTAKPGRRFQASKTRARFRVLVSTGRRPSEVMRAEATDVDLEARVWVVRDGKGGWSPGVYLNDDMLAAWRLFVEADAWGRFNISSFGDTLRRHGWPTNVRVYNARHTTWITAVERGADMADVQVGAGHRNLATTRQYTGVRNSRMQGLSERLEGRFGGFPVAPDSGPSDKP